MKYYGDIYNEIRREDLIEPEFIDECSGKMRIYLWYKGYLLNEAKKHE